MSHDIHICDVQTCQPWHWLHQIHQNQCTVSPYAWLNRGRTDRGKESFATVTNPSRSGAIWNTRLGTFNFRIHFVQTFPQRVRELFLCALVGIKTSYMKSFINKHIVRQSERAHLCDILWMQDQRFFLLFMLYNDDVCCTLRFLFAIFCQDYKNLWVQAW